MWHDLAKLDGSRVSTIELGLPKGKMVKIWPVSDFEIKYEIKMLTFGT